MKFEKMRLCCTPERSHSREMAEIEECITDLMWKDVYYLDVGGKRLEHQTAYNKAFEREFVERGWKSQPPLFGGKKGDFSKNGIVVEIQFGNSSTIYRDYYKFHYGYRKNILDLGVLILPVNAKQFFPDPEHNVNNMAEFDFACRQFKLLEIP